MRDVFRHFREMVGVVRDHGCVCFNRLAGEHQRPPKGGKPCAASREQHSTQRQAEEHSAQDEPRTAAPPLCVHACYSAGSFHLTDPPLWSVRPTRRPRNTQHQHPKPETLYTWHLAILLIALMSHNQRGPLLLAAALIRGRSLTPPLWVGLCIWPREFSATFGEDLTLQVLTAAAQAHTPIARFVTLIPRASRNSSFGSRSSCRSSRIRSPWDSSR